MIIFDPKFLEEIIEHVVGTCKADYDIARDFNLTEEEALEAMIQGEADWCNCCGWIYKMEDLDAYSGDLLCYNCQSDLEEEEENED